MGQNSTEVAYSFGQFGSAFADTAAITITAPEELAITREWLRSKANSIEGGTSEINLNVISKRVLDLPD